MILLVEDNSEIAESLEKYVERELRVNVTIAAHMKDAENLIGANVNGFAAFIVDLMLPKDEPQLTALVELDQQRAKALAELAEGTRGDADYLDEKTAALRYRVDELDREIDENLALEGGCEILEWYSDQLHSGQPSENRQPLDLPVIIFTARGLDEVRSRCERIVTRKCLVWREKPIDEKDIVNDLKDLLDLKS
ncbi:MAG: hypothetical protein ABSF98_22860 [Bryobacteraceae bacterium]